MKPKVKALIVFCLKPLRLKRDRLSSFMAGYFSQSGKQDLFDDFEFYAGCQRLSAMVGDRYVTVLLAKLFADQMIGVKDGGGDLPDNVPDLMLSYLSEINKNATTDNDPDVRVRASVVEGLAEIGSAARETVTALVK